MNSLTVIVAVYNTAQYLRECLNSIFAQSYQNFDILLMDDCSTDGSGEICEQYKEKYAGKGYNIEVIHNEVNLGVSATWEKAVCSAKTEWIYVVDSDDIIHPDLIKTLMDFVALPIGENVDIVQVGVLNLNDAEIEQHTWVNLDNPRFMIKYGNLSLKEKFDIKMGLGFSKNLLKKSLCLSIDYSEYKKKWPRRFFNDGLYTALLYQKAEVLALLEDIVYIQRKRINSTGKVLDRFDHLRDWMETDEELYRILQESGEEELSIEILHGLLNSISKLVYYIDRNKVDEKETKMKLVHSFKQYFKRICQEKTFYKSNSFFQRVSWRVFNINSYFWVKTIGYAYFEHIRNRGLRGEEIK